MFNRQSLHIAMLVWGGIFCLIAALCMCMSKNFDRDKRKWMLLMQTTAAVLLFSDALAWGFRGDDGSVGYAMVRISNFLVFFMYLLPCFMDIPAVIYFVPTMNGMRQKHLSGRAEKQQSFRFTGYVW